MSTAQLGDRVRIQFRRLPKRAAAPGKPNHQKTVEFTVGSRKVFPSLSLGVVGMAPGDRKQFTLQPREAYGRVRSRLVQRISRNRIPKHLELFVGQRLIATRGIVGRRRRLTVVEIQPDCVIVDGNHPLAGEVVELEVFLISLDSSADAKRSKPQFDMGGES